MANGIILTLIVNVMNASKKVTLIVLKLKAFVFKDVLCDKLVTN